MISIYLTDHISINVLTNKLPNRASYPTYLYGLGRTWLVIECFTLEQSAELECRNAELRWKKLIKNRGNEEIQSTQRAHISIIEFN